MTKARNLSLLSTVEVGATADQTKADIDALGIAADIAAGDTAARAGRKNLIINGGMQVSQRGAYTITTTGGPEYGGPDRFHMWSYASSEQVTAEISKSTVGGTPTGFANTCRIDVITAESSVAANESLVFAQYIEAQDCQHLEYGTSDAKSVTMSFWIKTSVTGTYCFFLQNSDGDRIQVKEYTVNSADTWEKKVITILGDASGTINNDNGRGLWCGWVLMAGTDRHGSKDAWRTTGADFATSSQVNAVDNGANNIYITGVQLEVGSVATDFEHRSYGEELALCLRYFWREAAIEGWFFPINPSNNVYFRSEIYFPTIMRSSPSVSVDSSITGTQYITNSKVSLRLNHIASYSTWTGITVSAEL